MRKQEEIQMKQREMVQRGAAILVRKGHLIVL